MAKKSNVIKNLYNKPKFSTRKKNICMLCGRSRGYMRRFRLCRICFRERALRGELPGVRKASW